MHTALDDMHSRIVPGLTRRQAQALAFVRNRIAAGTPSPSLQEIANLLGIRSRSGAHRVVDALVDYGYLCRVGKRLDLGSVEFGVPDLAVIERTLVKVIEKEVPKPPVAKYPARDRAKTAAARRNRTYVLEIDGDVHRRLQYLARKSGMPVEKIIAEATRDFVMG